MNNIVQIRLDNELKIKATTLFERMGLDLSSAIRLFLNKAVQTDGIPFSLNNENEYNYLSAVDNMLAMQQEAAKSGASKMTLDEINAEIAAVRKSRNGKM